MRRFLGMERLTTFSRWLAVALPPSMLLGSAPPDIILSVLASFFLLHCGIKRDFSWASTRWVQAALALVAFITVRTVFLPDMRAEDVGYSLTWVRFPLGAAALAYWLLPDPLTRKRLMISLGATVIFIIGDTLWQFVHGTDLFGKPPMPYDNGLRLTGPFGKPRPGIIVAWTIFPVLLALAAARMPRGRYILATSGLILAAALMITLSGERMGLLLYITGLALAFLLLKRMRLPVMIGGTAGLLAALAVMHYVPYVEARHVSRTSAEVAGFWESPYGATWISAVRVGMAHPLLGTGPKRFFAECVKPEYGSMEKNALSNRCANHTHNYYLAWFAEFGVPGLGLFLFLVLAIAYDMLRARPWNWRDPVAMGLLVTLILRFEPINITPNYFAGWAAVPLWLCVGWLYALLPNVRQPASALDEPK